MADRPRLLDMQAPAGLPRSSVLDTVSDPLLPPQRTADMLAHFYQGVYDLRPESHLSRLLKVLLGETGVGRLRKRYMYQHLSQVLYTTHFHDLDRMYAAIFGLRRLVRETLDIDPYYDTATAEEWEEIMARDAAYRARIEQFSRAIVWGGTKTGMELAAQAVLGVECRVYETYIDIDEQNTYGGSTPEANTYADVEALGTYGGMESYTYARLESTTGFVNRTSSRNEFLVRPLRAISDEERYQLIQVLTRLKPAGTLLTIDPRGVAVHTPLPISRVAADSTYWHVKMKVAPSEDKAHLYPRSERGLAVEQPRPVFSQYQGEAWSYNADVIAVDALVEDEEGNLLTDVNYSQREEKGQVIAYTPDKALADHDRILLGRYVSDGVVASSTVVRGKTRHDTKTRHDA